MEEGRQQGGHEKKMRTTWVFEERGEKLIEEKQMGNMQEGL